MENEKKHTNDHVLQIALDRDLHYNIPEGYKVGGMGLGRAVIYEAISRAKRLGAKRAVVLSQQEFYHRIGLEYSSEFCTWEPKAGNLL